MRSWQSAYRGLFPDDYLNGLRAEDRMGHYTFGDVRPDRPATIVAVADTTICGFATTGPSRDANAADVGELYAQGFTETILWVLTSNEQAQRFYHADGWQPDGHQRQEYVWGVLADEVRYRRCLP